MESQAYLSRKRENRIAILVILGFVGLVVASAIPILLVVGMVLFLMGVLWWFVGFLARRHSGTSSNLDFLGQCFVVLGMTMALGSALHLLFYPPVW